MKTTSTSTNESHRVSNCAVASVSFHENSGLGKPLLKHLLIGHAALLGLPVWSKYSKHLKTWALR